MTQPLDPFSEVVDERRRWTPDWYSWLKEVGTGAGGTAPWVVVTSFAGVDPTGVADSTVGIQNAINSIKPGQELIFPPGVYKISSTIFIGDGFNVSNSTYQGVRLKGLGVPGQSGQLLIPNLSMPNLFPVRFVWAGANNGTMVQVAGPISGWGVENIAFDGANVAGQGLSLVSAHNGLVDYVTIIGCKQFPFYLGTQTVFTVDGQGNTMHNTIRNLTVVMPAGFPTVFGIAFQGFAGSGPALPASCCYNLFENTTIVLLNINCFAMYLQCADTNHFIDTHLINYGGLPNAGITFDYTVSPNAVWPCSNVFDGVDDSGFGGTAWQVAGTPGQFARPNYITSLYEGNAGTVPILPNLVNLVDSGQHPPWTIATGTVNALITNFSQTWNNLPDGKLINVRATGVNTGISPTLEIRNNGSVSGFPTALITKNGGKPLNPGDIAGVGHELILRNHAATPVWELLNPRQPLPFVGASGGNNDELAINQLFGQSKTVWLPDQNYKISDKIILPAGGRLVGMGSGGTAITGMAGAAGITIPDQEACMLENFQLTGTMGTAVGVTGSNEFLMRRVWIEGSGITNGVVFSGLPYYARIHDCKINQVASKAISGTGTGFAAFIELLNTNIGGNNITVNGISTTQIGWNIVDSEILQTTGNAVDASGFLVAGIPTPAQGFSAYFTRADTCGGRGYNLSNFGSVSLNGSWASANSLEGVFVANSANVNVIGNRIHYNGRSGLVFSNVDDFEVVGNHIVNNGTSGAGLYDGLSFVSGCIQGIVSSNHARNGATGPAGNQRFGINVDGTCQFFTVTGNMFNNNVTGPWQIAVGAVLIMLDNSDTQVNVSSLPAPGPCTGSRVEVYDLAAGSTFGVLAAGGGVPGPGPSNGTVRSNGNQWTVCGI